MKVSLVSSFTKVLKAQFARGECAAILTTGMRSNRRRDAGELPLVWVGAPQGQSWRQRPLRLAFEQQCIFRPRVQAALDAAASLGSWRWKADSTRTIEATVSADLAVHTVLAGSEPPYVERIAHAWRPAGPAGDEGQPLPCTATEVPALQALGGVFASGLCRAAQDGAGIVIS